MGAPSSIVVERASEARAPHGAIEHGEFVAFVPLSSWLRGFDRYRHRWDKTRLPESRFPEAVYMHRAGEPCDVGLAKARSLVSRLGIAGDRVIALEARLPLGPGGMEPNRTTGTGVGWRWPAPLVPLASVAWVNERGERTPTSPEELTAAAYALADTRLAAWTALRPRTLSILPVARACQARCAFCFSKGSVSELVTQASLPSALVEAWARHAAERGAERGVITGGGEPTLLDEAALLAMTRTLREHLGRVTLITNGARLDAARLAGLAQAGLDVLAVSRHGVSAEEDARIFGIDTGSQRHCPIARSLGVRARAVCVLSKDGVRDVPGVHAYLERAVRDGFEEVCFKELYVASTAESPWAPSETNAYARAHQVPLATVLEALDELGFREVSRLPWGAPVLEGRVSRRTLRVAAYTEPSVGWERAHGLARSWNLLSDGRCFASLEDPASHLALPREGAPRHLAVLR